MAELPSGTVTFLFTDVEGSTELLKSLGGDYARFLQEHRRVLRDAAAAHGGNEMGTEGDAMFFWFARAGQAARAAADAQRALAAHSWPGDRPIRVRMGLHTGEPEVIESEYVGMGLHRAARISSAAHGGQVLLTGTTAGVLADEQGAGVGIRRLGEFRLKDMGEPEPIYQLIVDGLPGEFPPPRAEPGAAPSRRPSRRLVLGAIALAMLAVGGVVVAIALVSGGGKSAASTTTRPVTTSGTHVATTTRRTTTTTRPVEPTGVEQAWFTARFIPYPAHRKREMAGYAKRHYGVATWQLRRPRVIVEHYSVTPTAAATITGFAKDDPDPELGDLPGDCAHFVVDRDGTVYQLVRTQFMCRHTVGLNYTAIGVEHVGASDAQILETPKQLAASVRLTLWLMSRYRITLANVIGHNESLRSPFRKERYAPWRCQTHEDWTHGDMVRYRRLLYERGLAQGLRSLVNKKGIDGPQGETPGC